MGGMENIIFADLQGFWIENKFILKELCFLIRDSKENSNIFIAPSLSHHFIFTQPFAWYLLSYNSKKTVLWLTQNHHGIHWTQGTTDYNKINECFAPLLGENVVIYVKGAQKVTWLKELCNINIDCRNIEEIGCNICLQREENIIDRKLYHCNKHSRSRKNRCALLNSKIIEYWYHNNIAINDE
jgi:hypothetical protein